MRIMEKFKTFVQRKSFKVVTGIVGSLLILSLAFIGWIWSTTLQPDQVQPASVNSSKSAPTIPSGAELKLFNWNVQFMAGKGYDFYYEGGEDTRPTPEDIDQTTEEVVRAIEEEDPDIILLQEVDDGAKRTDHEDQLKNLMGKLPDEYQSHASAFYWKAAFSPHPKILGSVGMKLSVISKYKMESARRHQLALKPDNWFVRQFDLKRTALEVRFPRKEGEDFVVFNTHLTAFAYGSDVRQRQVEEIQGLLEERSEGGYPWVIGGDFNLRPPGRDEGSSDNEAIKKLFDDYRAVPGYEEVNGPNPEDWYTHFPNNPEIAGPDSTIDYYFLSGSVSLGDHYVRQEGTLKISDHLPVVAEVRVGSP
ncbi:endonuclease/exonuclease/phosphatase family protein [Candidatus Bipolaricaulota bacterium]|nr:endonuclease/exonuclease/phosphatase family protein [Candidatus Bipolaricaulota bacterium]